MADSEHQPDRLIGPATLASLVLVGIVALGALWLRSGLIGADQWPIQWLDVEGELQRTSASQVRAAAAGPAARGFFAVDLRRIRDDVEALPWIARAEVRRQWPDAIHVRVVEHRPVARWNESSLFSDQGEVFAVSGSDGMQGLARLLGPEHRRGEVLNNWQHMRAELGEIGLDIDSLKLDERGAWMLTLTNGTEVVLGRQMLDQRLARFIGVYEELTGAEQRPRRVDMRYTNGLAVRWVRSDREETTDHG